MPGRREYASYIVDQYGYPRWSDQIAKEKVAVHQLTAIMVGEGAETVFGDGQVVHHKNGIKWDNRPENLEVMSNSQHATLHYDGFFGEEKIDLERCEQIRKKYEKSNIPNIASGLGISESAVWDHLVGNCRHHSEDVTMGFDGPRDGPWRDRDRFYELYVLEGWSMEKLSEAWDCSLATLDRWKRKHNIEHDNRGD